MSSMSSLFVSSCFSMLSTVALDSRRASSSFSLSLSSSSIRSTFSCSCLPTTSPMFSLTSPIMPSAVMLSSASMLTSVMSVWWKLAMLGAKLFLPEKAPLPPEYMLFCICQLRSSIWFLSSSTLTESAEFSSCAALRLLRMSVTPSSRVIRSSLAEASFSVTPDRRDCSWDFSSSTWSSCCCTEDRYFSWSLCSLSSAWYWSLMSESTLELSCDLQASVMSRILSNRSLLSVSSLRRSCLILPFSSARNCFSILSLSNSTLSSRNSLFFSSICF